MRAFQGVEFTLETVSIYATSLASYRGQRHPLLGTGERAATSTPSRSATRSSRGSRSWCSAWPGSRAPPAASGRWSLAASAVAVVLSLGPETGVLPLPPRARRPPARRARPRPLRGRAARSRLAVLAGFCLAGRRWFVSLAALALVMVESTNVPLRLGPYAGPPEYARWLAGKPGAVAVLPLGRDDTQVMLDGVAHFRPLLNGDSGFLPRPYDRAMELLARAPGRGGLALPAGGGRDARRHARSRSRRRWPPTFGERRSPRGAAGPRRRKRWSRANRRRRIWGRDGARIDLGNARIVDRVVFEIGDGEWVSRPACASRPTAATGKTWPRKLRFPMPSCPFTGTPAPGGARSGSLRAPPGSYGLTRASPRVPALSKCGP